MCRLREVVWVGNSLDDLKKQPDSVKREIGYALSEVQKGKKLINAKPLKGFGTGVMEIVSNFNKNTYRAVYTVKLGEKIYVLHVFQKKSKKGIETPMPDIDLIKVTEQKYIKCFT